MKIASPLRFLLLLAFGAQAAVAQVTSPDTIVQRVVAALKAKDERAYLALQPGAEPYTRLTAKILAAAKKEFEEKNNALLQSEAGQKLHPHPLNIDSLLAAEFKRQTAPAQVAKREEAFAGNFRRTLAEGEKRGIHWANIRFVRFDADTAAAPGDTFMRKAFGSAYRSLSGIVHFVDGDSAYWLRIGRVEFLPEEGGWFGPDLQKLARGNEVLKADDELMTTEIVVESVEEDVPPPPPPPPPKPKAKTKSKSPGTKAGQKRS